MLMWSLCDCSDAYILVIGTIAITGAAADDVAKRLDERNKRGIFKNCAPFTDCISEISNTQIDNAKYIDFVMSMYNFNYSKTSGSLWQNYRDDPNDNIAQSESFKFKIKIIKYQLNINAIKILDQFLENSWNAINQLWN